MIIAGFLAWFVPYVRYEHLTISYGDEFTEGYRKTNMLQDLDYFKVVEYGNGHAEVYYVTGNHAVGSIVTFEKRKGTWEYTDWNVVWSKTGSAEGIFWPYILK
jgi:hypothetical protein